MFKECFPYFPGGKKNNIQGERSGKEQYVFRRRFAEYVNFRFFVRDLFAVKLCHIVATCRRKLIIADDHVSYSIFSEDDFVSDKFWRVVGGKKGKEVFGLFFRSPNGENIFHFFYGDVIVYDAVAVDKIDDDRTHDDQRQIGDKHGRYRIFNDQIKQKGQKDDQKNVEEKFIECFHDLIFPQRIKA